MVAGTASAGKRSRRSAPNPNSILDQKALLSALEDRGIVVKPFHIEGFYQALHRQHYPDLPAFVETFYKHENKELDGIPTVGPLKNAVSNRKNRNKVQLPKPFLSFLKDPTNGFVTVTSRVAQEKTSRDGMTTKLVVELHDGQRVESVLMRYISHDGSRASLCVSSQCGCAMGCTFCATGTMGLSGNLTTGEILEQIVHADRILAREWEEKWNKENHPAAAVDENADNNGADASGTPRIKLDLVRNVVFMGMGEPLHNYNNVVEACRALIHRKRWNLAHGRVTVSTVGLVPMIRKLTRELPEVSLALSLHAPNQAMRTAIVPTATQYPIESLVDALDEHMMAYLEQRKKRALAQQGLPEGTEASYTVEERIKESSRRRAMIEYVMLEGDTSSFECAHQLGKLCENRHLVVNLIPYNQTDVKDKLRCPSWEHMKEFQRIVGSYGTFCTIRKTMGADIDSACGQLLQTQQDSKDRSSGKSVVPDIEDALESRSTASGGLPKKRSTTQKREKLVVPNDQSMDALIMPLTVATTITAFCFVGMTAMYLRQRGR